MTIVDVMTRLDRAEINKDDGQNRTQRALSAVVLPPTKRRFRRNLPLKSEKSVRIAAIFGYLAEKRASNVRSSCSSTART